ncbi:MAG: hypothetical protein AAGF87_02050 [Bacteroidota bacterium]
MLALVIQFASGTLGGNLAGRLLRNLSMGPVVNSLLGMAGAGLGGFLTSMCGFNLGAMANDLDLAAIMGSIAAGGIGGGMIMAIVGAIRYATSHSAS